MYRGAQCAIIMVPPTGEGVVLHHHQSWTCSNAGKYLKQGSSMTKTTKNSNSTLTLSRHCLTTAAHDLPDEMSISPRRLLLFVNPGQRAPT